MDHHLTCDRPSAENNYGFPSREALDAYIARTIRASVREHPLPVDRALDAEGR